jgi:hypothetical protein
MKPNSPAATRYPSGAGRVPAQYRPGGAPLRKRTGRSGGVSESLISLYPPAASCSAAHEIRSETGKNSPKPSPGEEPQTDRADGRAGQWSGGQNGGQNGGQSENRPETTLTSHEEHFSLSSSSRTHTTRQSARSHSRVAPAAPSTPSAPSAPFAPSSSSPCPRSRPACVFPFAPRFPPEPESGSSTESSDPVGPPGYTSPANRIFRVTSTSHILTHTALSHRSRPERINTSGARVGLGIESEPEIES